MPDIPATSRLVRPSGPGHVSRLMAEGHLSKEKAAQWLAAWKTASGERQLDRLKSEWWAPAWEWIEAERREPR